MSYEYEDKTSVCRLSCVKHMLSVRGFFNDTATTEIYTLSLHDALPIYFKKRTSFETQQAFYLSNLHKLTAK